MKDNYYMDNAATTWPKPEVVYTFIDKFSRSSAVNPGRAGHQMAVDAEAMVVQTRKMLANFFGFTQDTDRVVFTLNATDSLNMAIMGIVDPGDHVIITQLEHNSVLRPINHLERDSDVSVSRIAPDKYGYIDPEDIRAALTPKTKLVIVNHASNVLGSVQDIAAIGKIVRESNAVFMVDTCQTAGVLPIDMEKDTVDVLIFTGHKGLFAPMGIGGLIVSDNIQIRASRYGGTGVDSTSPFQPDDYPYHLEPGTASLPGIAGLHAAQKWFAEKGQRLSSSDKTLSHQEACRIAVEHIHSVETNHLSRLSLAFRNMEGVTVYGPNGNGQRVATLSLNIDGLPADQVGAMLDADAGICCRTGLHCAPLAHHHIGTKENKGAVRFSPGYFTDDEDIEETISAVEELVSLYQTP
ncbi:MAG: aminotransferase class V-fold PLP-dependent enzyme [Rhodospirillales bacterium]|nr:aminotransferase class V-fold PLP-dependent enzyme [Rhodospirillales bacterium]